MESRTESIFGGFLKRQHVRGMSEDYEREDYNETRKLSVTAVLSLIFSFVFNICSPDASAIIRKK